MRPFLTWRDDMPQSWNVAVVGAAGLLGETLLEQLDLRDFPLGRVYALESAPADAASVSCGSRELGVEDLARFDFSQADLVFFAADASVLAEYGPQALAQGCRVIALAETPPGASPLVPELVPVSQGLPPGILYSPSAPVIMLALALKPLAAATRLQRVEVTVMLAASSEGRTGVEELGRQTADMLNFRQPTMGHFPKQIAFNLIPHSGGPEQRGVTSSERSIIHDLPQVLELPELKVSAAALMAPVFYGHVLAASVQMQQALSPEQAHVLLAAAPGLELIDADHGPTPVTEASGHDAIMVGRIRADHSVPCGLKLWIVGDNLRKGGAVNAIQIAERIVTLSTS